MYLIQQLGEAIFGRLFSEPKILYEVALQVVYSTIGRLVLIILRVDKAGSWELL